MQLRDLQKWFSNFLVLVFYFCSRMIKRQVRGCDYLSILHYYRNFHIYFTIKFAINQFLSSVCRLHRTRAKWRKWVEQTHFWEFFKHSCSPSYFQKPKNRNSIAARMESSICWSYVETKRKSNKFGSFSHPTEYKVQNSDLAALILPRKCSNCHRSMARSRVMVLIFDTWFHILVFKLLMPI